jgi:hypothetical protein
MILLLIDRFSKGRHLDKNFEPPNPFMCLVALFATSATSNLALGEKVARLLQSIAQRIHERDRRWLELRWPEILDPTIPYQPMENERRDLLIAEMDRLLRWFPPSI